MTSARLERSVLRSVRSFFVHVAKSVAFVLLVLTFALLVVKAAAMNASAQDFSDEEGPCGRWDPDCRRHIEEVFLQRTNLLRPEVGGGVRFGHGSTDAAIRFGLNVVAIDNAFGDLTVLPFEAMWLPDAGGFRVRFALAASEVSIFCTDTDGDFRAPQNLESIYRLIQLGAGGNPGLLPDGCRETGTVGVGGSLTEAQHDTATGRWAVRWAEINAVLNFLRNGNSQDYLKKRLSAFTGASVETVWPGSTPDAPGAGTNVRLNFGVTGLLRSDNNRFEFRGYAGYRPALTDWSNYAIEARTELLYNLLFSPDFLGSLGVEGEYSYWSRPSSSIGTYASDRDPHTAYVGAMFRLRWN